MANSSVKKAAATTGKGLKSRGAIKTLAKSSTAKTSNFNLRRG